MDDLTQAEADRLFALSKRRVSEEQVDWPLGAKVAGAPNIRQWS